MDDLKDACEKLKSAIIDLVEIFKSVILLAKKFLEIVIDQVVEDFRHEIDLMYPDY